MNMTSIDKLTDFIRANITLNFDDEKVLAQFQNSSLEPLTEFSDLFYSEIQRDEYNDFREQFDIYGPILLEKMKVLQGNHRIGKPDYFVIFSIFGFARIFEENEDLEDLSLAFYFILNSLSSNIDPGECNRIVETLSEKGKFHLIYKYGLESFDYLMAHDAEYFYTCLGTHINFRRDKYQDRIQIFEGAGYVDNLYEEEFLD